MTSDSLIMSGPDEFQSVNLSQSSVWIIDARAKRTDPHPQKIQVLHNSRPFGRSLKQSTQTLRSSTDYWMYSYILIIIQPFPNHRIHPPFSRDTKQNGIHWESRSGKEGKGLRTEHAIFRAATRGMDLSLKFPKHYTKNQGLRSAPQKSRIVSGLFNTLQSAFGSCCIK